MKHNKILILGSSGMLGSELTRQFYKVPEVEVVIALRELDKYPKFVTKDKRVNFIVIKDDLTFFKDLYHVLSKDNYLLVNCIGVTNRFESNKPKDILNMIQTNSILPNVLGMLQQEFKESTFINISTNCVFKDAGKKLDDSFYALSKRLGESPSLINLRTSLIGEEEDTSLQLLEWLKKQKGFVNGYTKAFWNGITTKEVFNILHEWNLKDSYPKIGTYNITSSNTVSKYELLELLKDKFGKDIFIKQDSSFKENKTLKHSSKLNYKQKTVEKMIEEMEIR